MNLYLRFHEHTVVIKRIVIAGQGSIGQRHLRLARQIFPSADIRVLRHKQYPDVPAGANGAFVKLSEALDFAPDIAVIANPATFHIDVALPLAAAGSHLLIEKPIAASVDDVEKLIEVCSKGGRVLQVGYNLRFHPSLQMFRAQILNNIIGRIVSVRCEVGQYLPSWRPDGDYRESVSAKRNLGGGALLELSHEIDYMRWIFGEVAWLKATLCRQSNLDIDVEDTTHLTLAFEPSTSGRQLVGSLNMDFVRHDVTRQCVAIGEEGSLKWDGITGRVELYTTETNAWKEMFQHSPQRDDSYNAEWMHFLDCINGSKQPLISGEDGLRVLQIVNAARMSSESGAKVECTPDRKI